MPSTSASSRLQPRDDLLRGGFPFVAWLQGDGETPAVDGGVGAVRADEGRDGLDVRVGFCTTFASASCSAIIRGKEMSGGGLGDAQQERRCPASGKKPLGMIQAR